MQITPTVYALKNQFKVHVAPGIELDRFVYCYLIFGEKITLIDTGVAGCETQIFNFIRSIGRDPSEISMLILTHSHPDHIGAARAIQRETGCSIAAHPAERTWIEDVDLQNRERPVPGFTSLVSGSVQIDRDLRDGDLIIADETRGLILEVLHTPGHSPGSISCFMQSEELLFSGDAIPVAGDLPVYDDAIVSVQSINRLRRLAGIRVLLSAWDKPRVGKEAYIMMEQGAFYLQKIHETVRAGSDSGLTDLMELTRRTAVSLGLPPQAVNPLLARSFAANLRVRDRKDLLEDPETMI